jgi:serine protease inhibitor
MHRSLSRRYRSYTNPVLFGLVALILSGCSKDHNSSKPSPDIRAARQIPEANAQQVEQLVQGNAAFALDLYAELKTSAGNLFFSPYSMSTAMGMIWAGARGETETEIAQVFHFPYGQDALHQTFGELQRSLDTGIGYDLYRLDIANRLWGQTGYPWNEPFLEITRVDYGAELVEADIEPDQESVRQAINTWVSERTAAKIPELVPEGLITPLTRLVLVNAIYFKGTWVSRFDAAQTQTRTFHVSGAQSVDVPMMHQTGQFGYLFREGVSVIELPYTGQDIAMVVLLPDAADGLAALEAMLTPENLAGWLDDLSATTATAEVAVSLPRFTFRWKASLAEPLIAMGMPLVFSPEGADLTGMAPRNLYLQFFIHEAFVAVDEEGTEAAAATAGGVGEVSMPPEFTADHPFLFLIRDRVTGSVLFLGRVVNPSA